MNEIYLGDSDSAVMTAGGIPDGAPAVGSLALPSEEDFQPIDTLDLIALDQLDQWEESERSSEVPRQSFSSEQEKLMRDHLPLAKSIAWHRTRRHGSFSDYPQILSDAYFGLVKGVLKHDPAEAADSKSTKNYLSYYIIGEIKRGMRDRYGRYYVGEVDEEGQIVKTERIGRRKPSVVYGTALSLDSLAEENVEGNPLSRLESRLADPNSSIDNRTSYIALREAVAQVVNKLPLVEREIFVRIVAQDQSRAQVAKDFGCSQMRISRLLKKIRERAQSELGLEDLIDS